MISSMLEYTNNTIYIILILKEMNVNYSPTMPASNIKAGSKMILNYLIKELTDEEIKALWEKSEQYNNDEPSTQFINDHKYSYYSISIGCGQWNYGGIVNAIIRDKYKNDEMEAITNNVTNIVSNSFHFIIFVFISDDCIYYSTVIPLTTSY